MTTTFRRLGRAAYAVFALAVASVALLPALVPHAYAYGQVTTRSIQMSSSIVGGSASYLVTFTPFTTATIIKGMVVDFCSNNPLIGTACTAPTGFSVGTPTVTGTSVPGQTAGTWASATANSGRTLELSNATTTGTPSGAAVSFTLTTATNPSSTAGTFYARIFTFATDSGAGSPAAWVTAAADGSSTAGVTDAGGIALSTTDVIAITANVQEQLTFCISKNTITGTCGGLVTPTITIGHTVGTSTVIDDSAVDETPAFTQVSTNATGGVKVRMKSSNSGGSCATNGGLSKDGGASCGIPGTGATAVAMTAGTAAFGMCVVPGAGVTATAPYLDSNGCPNTYSASSFYGMDGSSGTSVSSLYGSQIYQTSGPVNAIASRLNFLATASLTTPAGVYAVNENLIATGTF